ncbi:MAG: hypothetical protein P4L10_14980 [Acidobacteriaceae bacterium]|nr:hypothetical protein [Acidobacteriaceae bacterium]
MWGNSGKPELLITTTKDGVTSAGIYAQNDDLNYVLSGQQFTLLSGTQPFVADINGDFLYPHYHGAHL